MKLATPAALVAITVATAACGHGKAACAVIDAAHDACVVLRYLETDGTVREVRLTPEEANALGRAMAAKRAASPDGGAP